MKNNTTSNTEMVTISRAEYQSLKDENAELSGKVEYLMEQMRLTLQKRFGASSKQTTADGMEQLSYLFHEAEVYANETDTPAETTIAAHTRKKKSGDVRDILPDNQQSKPSIRIFGWNCGLLAYRWLCWLPQLTRKNNCSKMLGACQTIQGEFCRAKEWVGVL